MSTMPSVGSGTYSPGPNMVCSSEQEKVGTGSREAIICPVYSNLRIRATVSCNANFAAEFPRHSVCQVTDIDIVTPLGDTRRCWRMLHEDVADFVADQTQPVKVESR